MTYAFAAAGTGGHLFPAIAVANELTHRGVDAGEIVFFGGDRLETDAVPGAGYELVQLDIRGLRRSLSVQNLELPFLVRRAARTVADELLHRSSRVVTAFGGYVTVPAGMGATRAGIPLVLHEQNAVPGLANRFTTRRAARTLVAFPSSLPRLSGAELTGNPLPERIAGFDRDGLRSEALSGYGLAPEGAVLGVVGGSQGAAAINERIAAIAPAILEGGHAILHLTGPAHADAMSAVAASHHGWVVVPYEDRMDRFYAAADLVVSRAGAMTISELTATGTPAVVVPLPAGKGYQAENAREMEQAGGCVVVHQGAADGMARLLTDLLADADRRAAMAASAAEVGRRDAAGLVADAILEVADG